MERSVKKYAIAISGMLLFICIFGLSAIFHSYASDGADKTGTTTSSVYLNINNTNILLDKSNEGSKLNATTLNSEFPTAIKFTNATGMKIRIDDHTINTSKSYNIKLNKLNSNNFIKISVEFSGQNKYSDYYINTIPSDFPKYTVKGKDTYAGNYYMTASGCYIFKLNNSGEVVYYRRTAGSPFDFKKVTVGDLTRYCYLEGESSPLFKMQSTGYLPTKAIVMDEKYNVIDNVTLIKNGDIPEGYPSENHDFKILGDHHYIVDAYYDYVTKDIPKELNPLPNGSKVIDYVFQEIKDGKVIFQWDTAKHPELYGLSVEGNDYQNKNPGWADWAHFNALTIDPSDDNFVCSYRNLDTLVKIDRKTGKVLWFLGGKSDQFGLTPDQKFSRQHNITISKDGTYTLFDNGNDKKQTRILKFSVNEAQKKLTSFKAFEVKGRFSGYMGSAQLIDADKNIFVICWGGGYNGSKLPVVSEIDFSSNKNIFEIYYNDGTNMYRTYKY